METKVKFPVGSKVKVLDALSNKLLNGMIGVVKGNEYAELFEQNWNAVQFEEIQYGYGHDCDGLLKQVNGWWMLDIELELVEE